MALFKSKQGFSIDGKADLLYGTDAPNAGAGVVAPVASLYLRNNGGVAELWKKNGAGDTAWVLVATDVSAEDPHQNTFVGKGSLGSVLPTYGSPNVVANNDSILAGIVKIDTKIGANPTPVARANNPIVAIDPLQTNIDKLDSAIGGNPTSTVYVNPAQTVGQNLSALDAQTSANTNAIGALQTGQKWITGMQFITSENLTARSGLAQFTDDQVPYTLPVAGDRVVSTFDNKIYIASAGAWTVWATLALRETFFVRNDLLSTSAYTEGASAYSFNGSSCVLQATFDFEAADSINLTSGYLATSGNPSPSDSVQKAISNIDGNVDALTSTMGVAQGNTTLGTWTGTGATRLFTANVESAKTAIQKVANDIGGSAGGSGDYASNQAINSNVNVIDGILTESHKKIAVNNIPTATVYDLDTIDLSGNNRSVEWDIIIISSTNAGNRYSSKLRAIASTIGSDYTEYAILSLGTTISNVTISLDTTTLNASKLKVTASVVGGYNVKMTRKVSAVA